MNKIQQTLNETDRKTLCEITSKQKYTSTLLPIKTVGVQVNIFCFCYGSTVRVYK